MRLTLRELAGFLLKNGFLFNRAWPVKDLTEFSFFFFFFFFFF
jgi:hypothetical protein